MRLVLEALGLPRRGSRVLHFAPETSLHGWLRERTGDGYDPVDFDPWRYRHAKARKFDLTVDAERLESASYDLIIHSHVMEHIPCNVTAVLFHLHRALKPDGMQVCCIPFLKDRHSEESFEALSPEEATRRFGQHDHLRRFGALDAAQTIGMIFALPDYDLRDLVPEEDLVRHNIPRYAWTGLTQHTILTLAKADLKLHP
jgi:phosphoglycolate phosphatase